MKYTDVIDDLRLYRTKNNISQETLAIKLRTTKEYICLMERKKKKPSYRMLNNWCFALGFTLCIKKVDVDIFNK